MVNNMEIKNLNLGDYLINLNIADKEVIGVFSRNKDIVTNFLLVIAGINRSKDACFYNDEEVYDNSNYFKERIYFDCKDDNVQTLNGEKLSYTLRVVFQKEVNQSMLEYHIKNLAIRGECEITSTLEYNFTPVGRTLINMALGLSINNHLLINNPTFNLTDKADINYLKLAIQNHPGFIVLGLDDFDNLKEIINKMVVFSDFQSFLIINPLLEHFYVIEDCLDIKEYRLFKAYGNRVITIDIPKDVLRKCDRNKIKYTKVSINEIKKYLSN